MAWKSYITANWQPNSTAIELSRVLNFQTGNINAPSGLVGPSGYKTGLERSQRAHQLLEPHRRHHLCLSCHWGRPRKQCCPRKRSFRCKDCSCRHHRAPILPRRLHADASIKPTHMSSERSSIPFAGSTEQIAGSIPGIQKYLPVRKWAHMRNYTSHSQGDAALLTGASSQHKGALNGGPNHLQIVQKYLQAAQFASKWARMRNHT